MSKLQDAPSSPLLLGHPTGLFTLFFAEMWERFSFYGMRALLVLYMIKGFLGYGDDEAYTLYGAYTALVYMVPFFGGMLADRLLGARRAVVLGGTLMGLGQSLLMVRNGYAFFAGLALLICGNGFFKPNISTIVGTLYRHYPAKRDGGFTIFYMGVNLGAAMSPLICGYIGETYGWHLGFGLATIGMLIGLAIFVAPTRVTQGLILAGALAAAMTLTCLHPDDVWSIGVNVFVAVAILISGATAWAALGRGGIPAEAGSPPDPERLHRRLLGLISVQWAIYVGAVLAVPVLALLVSGFATFTANGRALAIVPDAQIDALQQTGQPLLQVLAVCLQEVSRPANLVLMLSALGAFVYLGIESFRLDKIARERMFVILILTFFSMLFFAFFEQAGSSLNNFTDRNFDRVFEERQLGAAEVGQTLRFRVSTEVRDPDLKRLPLLSQEQLGHRNGNPAMQGQIERAIRAEEAKKAKLSPEKIEALVAAVLKQDVLTITGLTYLRAAAAHGGAPPDDQVVDWRAVPENEGMGIGGAEIPASAFQAVNPVFILVFGLAFSALWSYLGARGLEPRTTVKFAMGLLQLGLGFGVFWYGAFQANDRGMVTLGWLLVGYLLHTGGELCLSPVGLAMVTRLSPSRLVSTVMGAWFLATAVSQSLAAIIAQFTRVTSGGSIPPPAATVHVYGRVYGWIALAALVSALLCFLLAPLLNRWMHPEVDAV